MDTVQRKWCIFSNPGFVLAAELLIKTIEEDPAGERLDRCSDCIQPYSRRAGIQLHYNLRDVYRSIMHIRIIMAEAAQEGGRGHASQSAY